MTSIPFGAKTCTAVLGLCSVGALLVFAHACGGDTFGLTPEQRDRYYREKYSATDQNVSSWAHLWDKRSWLVGMPRDLANEPDFEFWRSVIIDGLTDYYAPQLLPSETWRFRDLLSSSLDLTFTHAPNRGNVNFGLEPGDTTEWYGKIELPPKAPLWEPLLGFRFPLGPLEGDALATLAVSQFQALSSLERFEWVEPNLGSDTQQADSGSPTTKCQISEEAASLRPYQWYCNGDGTPFENPAENRIRRVLSLVRWPEARDALEQLRKDSSTRGDATIPVAVIDTGVDYKHSQLLPRMYANQREIDGNQIDDDGNGFIDDYYGFDATVGKNKIDTTIDPPGPADAPGAGVACPSTTARCGHGTHVAGSITAFAEQGLPEQVANCQTQAHARSQGPSNSCTAFGVCDACRIFSIRAAERCLEPEYTKTGVCKRPTAERPPPDTYYGNGKIFDWDQTVGLNYLLTFDNPEAPGLAIFIVNLSLGKYLYNRTMYSALAKLEAQGVLIVAAAGNDNTETPMFPAAYPSTLAVCATSEDRDIVSSRGTRGAFAKADFSNFGDWVDICAPGKDIQSTFPGGTYRAQDGTSMASPLVAGAAGLLWSALYDQGPTNRDIRNRIVRYANAAIYEEPLNSFYGDIIGGVPNYLLGTGMLDVYGALVGEEGGAKVSAVATFKDTGVTRQVKSGCVVSAIGSAEHSGRWTVGAALTTMPFMALQFLIGLFALRRYQMKRRRALA